MSVNSDEMYPVLPGANTDSGGRYEYLMASLVSLKCLQDSTFTDFKISINNQNFGKFDDLVVETQSRQCAEHTWALQLKHVKPGKVLTKNELSSSKGDFSIQKYFEDYIRDGQQNYSETTLILYTNKLLEENKEFEINGKRSYIFKTFKINKTNSFDTSQNCSVYQFEINLKPGPYEYNQMEFEDYKRFLSQFYLYSSQNNVDGIEGELLKLFTDIYRSDGEDKYVKFFADWCRREAIEGLKQKLYKTDIELELSKILLKPHVVPISRMKSNDRGELLKQAICKFNVTVLPEECQDLVQKLWETCDSIQDWNGNELPLVVNVNATNQHSVYSAINLCPNQKFVLVGDCVDLNRLNHVKVFQNLSNLQGKDCYRKVLEDFSCVIQGREKTRLVDILDDNPNLKNCFGVGELLKMVGEKPLVIGDDTASLPASYIHRSIPKQIFSLDLIRNLGNDALVITCAISKWNAIHTKIHAIAKNYCTIVLKNEFLNKAKEPTLETPLIILIEGTCSADFDKICNHMNQNESVHHFQMIDENNLIWIKTRGKITQLVGFQIDVSEDVSNEAKFAAHYDFSQYFSSNLHVLAANPGMGKSVFLHFLKRKANFDVWPVLINLREKVSVFKQNTSGKDLVKKILRLETCNELVTRLQKMYEQRIVFLWDGLDEVGSSNVECILDGIKKISELGYSQWITSRRHLNEQKQLENFLNIFTVNFRKITYNDQKKYIKESLNETYSKNIDDVTSNIFRYIQKSELKNMLGIPLMLYIFTQICLDTTKYQHILDSELTWFRIYDIFVEGKFKHFSKKGKTENDLLFSIQQEHVRSAFSSFYQKVALKACFGDALDAPFSEKLNADCDDFLKGIAVNGDLYGIITKVDKNTIMFMHQTFAEYFTALYLARKFKTVDRKILMLLFREEHKTIRLFFDMCLGQNCPAHLAVLELNVARFENIAQNNVNDLFLKDEGGRNCLHIACSYGVVRPPLIKVTSKKTFKTFFDTKLLESRLELSAKKNQDNEKIIDILVSCLQEKEEYILHNDAVFEMNCLQYADSSMVLFPIIAIFATQPLLLETESKKLFDSFCNYKHIENFIAYSIIFNYENFISILKHIPYFECRKKSNHNGHVLPRAYGGTSFNSLMLMVQFGRVGMLKRALQNESNAQNINVSYHKKQTLLSWAIAKNNLDMVKLLTEHSVETSQLVRNFDVLHIAIERTNLEMIKYLIESKLIGHIDKVSNIDKHTPLLNAISREKYEIGAYLIAQGANIDAKDSDGCNILHMACSRNGIKFIKSLTQENLTNFDNNNNRGETPLLVAAELGYFEIVKYLIDNGADIHAKKSFGNILHLACLHKKIDFIKRLTREILINFDNGDIEGRTPLMLAAQLGNYEIFRHLIDNGANMNAKSVHGSNALHLACAQKQKINFVKSLAQEDLISFNTSDNKGETPLLLAARLGNFEIVNYLIAKGGSMYAKMSCGYNILHSACATKNMKLIKNLAKKNLIKLDNGDYKGRTPLLYAAYLGNFTICRYLLDSGANKYAKSIHGSNILHFACAQKESIEFVKGLTQEDLKSLDSSDENGRTPLILAAELGFFEIVKYLTENGANMNAKSANGSNILHLACERQENIGFVKSLTRENLINLNNSDNKERTPLMIAAQFGNFEIFRHLMGLYSVIQICF